MWRPALILMMAAACGGDAKKQSQAPAPARPAAAEPAPPPASEPAPEPPAPIDPPSEPAGAPLPARSPEEIGRCKGALAAGNRRCAVIVATGDPLQPGAASKELETATHCFAARSQACACACNRAGAGEGDCNYMTPVDTTDGTAIAICAD